MRKICFVPAILLLLSLLLGGCSGVKTQEQTEEPLCSVKTEESLCIDMPSLIFNSTDELKQAMTSYADGENLKDDEVYNYNNFAELRIDRCPVVTDGAFTLQNIEINPYNVFYYFIPVGTEKFDYKTGITVTFPREKATITDVGLQMNASYEEDGSFFDEQHHTWFVPLENSYYSIRFPDNDAACDKSAVILAADP